jgi:glycosyltransferase involved in cell wall biosynthesis
MKNNKHAVPTDGETLNVLFLVNRLYEWSQNFITRELTELDALGVKMTIAARSVAQRTDLSPAEQQLLRHYHPIPENPFLPRYWTTHLRIAFGRPRAWLSAWKTLFSLKHKPAKFPRGLVCLFRAATLTDYIEKKQINLIHAHFLTAAGETALYLSKLTGIPFGATAYAMDIYVDNSGLAGKLRHAAYVNGTTRYNERTLARLIPEHPERIVTCYYGIYPAASAPAPLPHDTFNFLAVGRLVPKKGFHDLLLACDLLQRKGYVFYCEIIGSGPLEKELREQIQTLGLDGCVTLTGFVAPNDLPDRYRSGDVLVAPCIVAKNGDVDGLPNVCLEAMNYGLPVISTTISGIPEAVEPGINGWLVPPENPEKLAETMEEAMHAENLPALRRASHQLVSDRFDVRKNVIPIRDLLDRHRKR